MQERVPLQEETNYKPNDDILDDTDKIVSAASCTTATVVRPSRSTRCEATLNTNLWRVCSVTPSPHYNNERKQ